MGRAFPELQMTTLGINGVKGQPAVMADEKGNTVTVRAIDDKWLERISRQATSVMGGYTILASYPCTGRQLKDYCIPDTPTLCEEIGRTLREARRAACRPHRGRAERDERDFACSAAKWWTSSARPTACSCAVAPWWTGSTRTRAAS